MLWSNYKEIMKVFPAITEIPIQFSIKIINLECNLFLRFNGTLKYYK